MNKLVDLLAGHKVLATKQSKINGELTVVKDIAWGVHIMGGGVTQSGGVAQTVWNTSLKKAKLIKPEIRTALVLGLGGGSIAKLIRKHWGHNPKITGVEIDPIIVELGKKHMKLDDYKVNIKITDAQKFIKKNKARFDLVCIDMYVQTDIPKKFETEKFIEQIHKLMNKGGIVVFNRLYYDEKRKSAHDFALKLEKTFPKTITVYPEANIMFVCKK